MWPFHRRSRKDWEEPHDQIWIVIVIVASVILIRLTSPSTF